MAEASLTGESHAVTKDITPFAGEAGIGDRVNMIFSGTVATFGRGKAVVTGTGMQTEMGKIAGLMQATPEEDTPLQKEIDRVGKLLGIAVIIIAVVIVATIVLVNDVRTFDALVDALLLGVSLAVAAVPEGLPTILTVVLALGVQRMAKRNAIVRKLSAVETLGSASVICSDKTGTLTKNEMTVRTVVTASGRVDLTGIGYDPTGGGNRTARRDAGDRSRLLATCAARCLRAPWPTTPCWNKRKASGPSRATRPRPRCWWRRGKIGIAPEELDQRFTRIGEVPFSSDRKLMSTVQTDVENEGAVAVVSKGRAGCAAGALHARALRRRDSPADGRAARSDPGFGRAVGGRGAAHAGRGLPAHGARELQRYAQRRDGGAGERADLCWHRWA